jgi:inner membrane protein
MPGYADDQATGLASGGIDVVGIALVDPVNIYSKADRRDQVRSAVRGPDLCRLFSVRAAQASADSPDPVRPGRLALAIFFLLLVSLSEHIAFGTAYLIASAACIGLLGLYLSAVLRSRARGASFAAMLAVLYAALYGLLASEDNALVLGTALLFVSLATLMLATRRVMYVEVISPATPTGLTRPL